MAEPTFSKRAQGHPSGSIGGRIDKVLGNRWAYLATAVILLLIFGWTFFVDPGRPAAADDPAYYTWRTEALLADEPRALLDIRGPLEMYSSGYRVATPVIAGVMRQVTGMSMLSPTIVLAVGLRVLIPLLLAGFAYRSRRDPLLWHAVAFGSASLLLTPPFGGYLDNVLTLFFLSAAVYLIEPSRTRWLPRVMFFALLVISGLTHPTTLAIFCVVLGGMAVVRLIYRGFSLRSVVADDGPMLVTAFLAAITTYAIWKVGAWGPPASLSEAALPPPAGADFFKTRLGDWVAAMRPPLNGPLFLAGVIGLLATGRRAAEDELSRVSLVWLAPLAGILGVFAGLSYPYYRFFNTTTSWILLVGVGAYLVVRFLLGVAQRGGIAVLALLGVAAIIVILAGNFQAGLAQSHWNDASDAWVKPDQKRDLEALRAYLDGVLETEGERPVVFVVDDDAPEPVRIYGFAKLAGNVSRYGVPGELQEHTSYYLGSVENLVAGRASSRDDYYAELSRATLEDSESRSAVSGGQPLIVVPEVFNRSGANAAAFGDDGVHLALDDGAEIVYLEDGTVSSSDATTQAPSPPDASILHLARVLLAGLVLLIPGALLTRSLLPGVTLQESVAFSVAVGTCLIGLVGFALLAVTGSPLGVPQAWISIALSIALAGAAFLSPASDRVTLASPDPGHTRS